MKYIIIILLSTSSLSVNGVECDKIYKGKYSWGEGVHSFTPCNSNITYWVSFNWAGIEMHEYYKSNLKNPYQIMYIKFRGHMHDEVLDGFAEEYDGLIHISEVKEYSFELPASCN